MSDNNRVDCDPYEDGYPERSAFEKWGSRVSLLAIGVAFVVGKYTIALIAILAFEFVSSRTERTAWRKGYINGASRVARDSSASWRLVNDPKGESKTLKVDTDNERPPKVE
jgi:hypothetical protein